MNKTKIFEVCCWDFPDKTTFGYCSTRELAEKALEEEKKKYLSQFAHFAIIEHTLDDFSEENC